MTPPLTAFIVDVLGFLTGTVLYVMLVTMVWRERAAEGTPFLAHRGRLTLLMGLAGLVWNVGALVSFGARTTRAPVSTAPALVALSFSALGFLPAIVVHSLLQGRETAAGRGATRIVIATAYLLSTAAMVLQMASAARGVAVPSHAALWLLTGGFVMLVAVLLVMTRRQPVGRRGVWVAALALFAVSALHFGRHAGNESWWVEVLGHHASIPLALAILHQDYRFALADLFLKNAIGLLMLVTLSLALFAGVAGQVTLFQGTVTWNPQAVAVIVTLWLTTALAFPALRRMSNRFVDRVVLRRPDYEAALAQFSESIATAETEDGVVAILGQAMQSSVAITDPRAVPDPLPQDDHRLVVAAAELRQWWPEGNPSVLLRIRSVDEPHLAVVCGPLAGGRRLLSDDTRLLEAMSQRAARQIDALRVTRERLERNIREQAMQRLATEAELRALRAQLHPHFLFNALTTIGHLIRAAPDRAVETLLRLTTVLRGVLRRSATEFSTLGDEIEFIRAYLEIEQARFEERLKIRLEIGPELYRCRIPTLLLQPLVENAVKHGLGPSVAGGTLRVAAAVAQGRLHIEIDDTGLGFDSDRRHHTGVGLTSVSQRLSAHYGSNASLVIQSAPEQGTSITIDMPAEHAPVVHLPRRRTG